MAARTASVSGLWSSTATWGGAAVPVDGDTFTINSSVVVDMDANTSGFASGLGASTINGTLRAYRSAGTYYLKMNGTLTVSTTGTLDASDGSGGAYLSTATFTILLNGNFSVTVAGNGVVNLICGEPVTKYVNLSQAEILGATTLHVNTDVSGDALWAGALIRVDNINQAAQSEERTVSGTPSSTVITITVGLTAAKASGAYISLVTRNVKILGASTASGTGVLSAASGVISAEIRLLNIALNACVGCIVGGSVSNFVTGLASCSTCTINGVITGGTTGISSGSGNVIATLISGCATAVATGAAFIVSGILSGGTAGLSVGAGHLVSGTISGFASGISAGSGFMLRGATLTNNTRDMNNVSSGQAFNTLFNSATEFLNYAGTSRSLVDYFESFDHDQVAGAFRAWTTGGITSTVASPVYDNRVRSFNGVCESASKYAFWQRSVLVPAYGSVNVAVAVQKDASMSYLPNVQIFPSSVEPLISGSPSLTLTMTNSTNTWEVLEGTVTNSTDASVLYTVRMLAKNASGNVYWSPVIRVSSFFNAPSLVGQLAL